MTPEFLRPERLDTIGSERSVAIEATAAEREALARRFALIAVDRLAATLSVARDAAGIAVAGRVTAQVVQPCSVTGDPLPATVDEPVALRFVEPRTDEEEIELGDEAIDTVEIEGSAIDLGEVAAETMALALDPFPRSPAAEAALRDAGVVAEDEVVPAASPFGALAALKDTLGKK